MFQRKRKFVTLLKVLCVLLTLDLLFMTGLFIYGRFYRVQVQIAHVAQPSASASFSGTALSAKKNLSAISDDWTYADNAINIKISKEQKYSGKDTVTMFIADVTLKSADYLKTAFAKDSFGMHITQKLMQIAQSNHALFAVNGDFYGYRDNGIIVRNGVLYRDKPARDMLAIFKNGMMSTINEYTANISALMSNGLIDAFSFGPALVKNGAIAGDLTSVFRDSWFIQGNDPRTGIGFIAPNHFLFIVVDGRKEYYSRGLTLLEFAREFYHRGCTQAYNLDGGGSSTMYFKGRIVNSPLGKSGSYQRFISDIIYIPDPQ